MTAVFIGNATKQDLHFAYRLPERKGTITQKVPFGGQKKLVEDMSQFDIDAIITQWGKYGLIKADELESSRREFQGYMISIGKPIPKARMDRAAEYRELVLKQNGEILRKQAAMAMVNTIEKETQTVAKNYEVSVVEQEPRGGYDPNSTHVAEGWRVDRDQRPDASAMPAMPVPSRGRRRSIRM